MFPLRNDSFKSVIIVAISSVLFLQYIIRMNPNIIPPKCAKCATLSPGLLASPENNSIKAYPITKYLALMGNGSGKTNIGWLGNSMPNPSKMAYTAPRRPDGSHHVEIFFHGDDGIPGIDTVVCGKHRFVMDVLYKLLDKPCTDAACEVVEQEAFQPQTCSSIRPNIQTANMLKNRWVNPPCMNI